MPKRNIHKKALARPAYENKTQKKLAQLRDDGKRLRPLYLKQARVLFVGLKLIYQVTGRLGTVAPPATREKVTRHGPKMRRMTLRITKQAATRVTLDENTLRS